MNSTQLFLGFIGGVTIVLGLPVALMRGVTIQWRAFLNAVSTGILIFLLVEITGHVLEGIEDLLKAATGGHPTWPDVLRFGGLFIVGMSVGLLGLVWFEHRFIGAGKDMLPPKQRAQQLALMIAVGLGLHNLSEGLAIGQSYSFGDVKMAWLLALGFALHNATEGFGIAAPLASHRPSWRFLGLCALIGGGPTFLGTVIGSFWVSQPLEIFCLSLASGSILYIIGELLHLGRQLKGEALAEIGLLIGFFVALITDFLVLFLGG